MSGKFMLKLDASGVRELILKEVRMRACNRSLLSMKNFLEDSFNSHNVSS